MPGGRIAELVVVVVAPAHYRAGAGDRERMNRHAADSGRRPDPSEMRNHVLQARHRRRERARDRRVVAKLAEAVVAPGPHRAVVTRAPFRPCLRPRSRRCQSAARSLSRTLTGCARGVVVPSPSRPDSLVPHAQTLPSDFSARVCVAPAAIATTFGERRQVGVQDRHRIFPRRSSCRRRAGPDELSAPSPQAAIGAYGEPDRLSVCHGHGIGHVAEVRVPHAASVDRRRLPMRRRGPIPCRPPAT